MQRNFIIAAIKERTCTTVILTWSKATEHLTSVEKPLTDRFSWITILLKQLSALKYTAKAEHLAVIDMS